jgi:hypothetical protein
MKTLKAPIKKKPIPFDFVLEAIGRMNLHTKPMFGCTAVYVDEKIVFALREKTENAEDNGVWIATIPEHHKSLKKELPSMRSITLLGPGPTGWQVLPSDAVDFEESVLAACDLVLANDLRIGKIPKGRSRLPVKKKSKSTK